MANLNKILLLGNIGRVDVKTFQNGDRMVNATLATTERYTDRNGEKRENTDWHRLVIAGRQAGIFEQYVTTGTPVLVEGRMRYREYTNAENVTKSIAEVVVASFQLLGKSQKVEPAPAPAAEPNTDDLPFD